MPRAPSPPKHFYTLNEYFALERVGDARYEYYTGEIFCMSGGSEQHGRIAGNIFAELHSQLKKRQCEAFSAEIPIKTPILPPIAILMRVLPVMKLNLKKSRELAF
ncbi:MAG: Uma2 family endonuclease [Acidobacteria bacterium]|nr:Uma2 family endonuclease [Acidobacteriota bacterium]